MLLTLLLLAPLDPCSPLDAGDRFVHFSEFAPVFEGGVVVRVKGTPEVLKAALADLGIQGSRTRACPKDLLVWVPGATEQVGEVLAKKAGLSVLATLRFSAGDGRDWLLTQCADAGRCEALTSQSNADGLCGYTLQSLSLEVSKDTLTRCRALAPEAVACALRETKACRRTFQAAMGAKR